MVDPPKKKAKTPTRFDQNGPRRSVEHRVINGRRQRTHAEYTRTNDEMLLLNQQIMQDAWNMINEMDNWPQEEYLRRRSELEAKESRRAALTERRNQLAHEFYYWDDLYWHGGGDNFQPPPPPPPPAPPGAGAAPVGQG